MCEISIKLSKFTKHWFNCLGFFYQNEKKLHIFTIFLHIAKDLAAVCVYIPIFVCTLTSVVPNISIYTSSCCLLQVLPIIPCECATWTWIRPNPSATRDRTHSHGLTSMIWHRPRHTEIPPYRAAHPATKTLLRLGLCGRARACAEASVGHRQFRRLIQIDRHRRHLIRLNHSCSCHSRLCQRQRSRHIYRKAIRSVHYSSPTHNLRHSDRSLVGDIEQGDKNKVVLGFAAEVLGSLGYSSVASHSSRNILWF